MAFCRQCYLPGSACRCLGSCSTTSTASTTGPLWSDIADPTFGTNSASAGRGAGSALPYGSSATAGSSIWDLPSADFPRLPGAPSAIHQPCPPAGRASHLESQLMAIRYGMTAPPDPLRLPQPTWRPPTTQNCRRVSCLRLRLGLIQPRRLTRASRRWPRTWSMRDQEPSDPGKPGHVAVLMDPPHRCLVSHAPPSWLRDVLVERLDLNSSGLLTGTRWPSFQPTVAGVGKKTWTFIWGPILGSITGRSQPPSGPN